MNGERSTSASVRSVGAGAGGGLIEVGVQVEVFNTCLVNRSLTSTRTVPTGSPPAHQGLGWLCSPEALTLAAAAASAWYEHAAG